MTKVYCHGFESSYLCNDFGDTKVNLGHALAKQSCMAHCRISLMFYTIKLKARKVESKNVRKNGIFERVLRRLRTAKSFQFKPFLETMTYPFYLK